MLALLLHDIMLELLTTAIKEDKYITEMHISKIIKLELFIDIMILYIKNLTKSTQKVDNN